MRIILVLIFCVLAGTSEAQFLLQEQNTGTSAHLSGICFTDADHGWAVGSSGTIIRTVNGGTTWTTMNSGTTGDLTYVWFTDNSKGFALGYSTFVTTNDGGTTWTSATAPFSGGTGMWFTDSQTGFIKTNSDIYKTTDGGNNWTVSAAGVYTLMGNLHFSDAQNGWTVCPGIYTSNGGSSWQNASIPAMCDAMRWVWFTSPSTGYVVDGSIDGTDGGGKFWKTTSGGMAWEQKQTGLNSYLSCVRFTSPIRGWVCGRNGVIASTSDAGDTWISYNPLSGNDLNQIFFLNESNGWITGDNGTIISCREQQKICLITVDPVSQKNMLYWEAPYGTDISSWNVYRETTSGNYTAIGTVPFSSSPLYTDASSQPSVQSYRYKLSFVNSSGFESAKSPYHQTMNLSVTQGVPSTTMTLIWSRYEDESGEFVPDYYYIYRGTSPAAMQLHDSVSGAFNMYNDLGVSSIYYYRIEIEKMCGGVLRGGSNNGNNDFNTVNYSGRDPFPYIYPNPANEDFTFVSPDKEGFTLHIKDLSGRIVKEFPETMGELNGDISELPAGSYILELRGKSCFRTILVKE